MKIAIVNQFYQPFHLGGAEISVQQIAEGLAARGHQVRVATTQTGELPPQEWINGVEVHRFSLPNIYTWNPTRPRNSATKLLWHGIDSWNPMILSQFGRWLGKVRPDVLHTNVVSGFSPAVWQVAKQQKDFYLLCIRANMFRGQQNCEQRCSVCRFLSVPRLWATRAVDAVVGISQFMLGRHLQGGYFGDVRIQRVIHNAFGGQVSRAPRSPGASNVLRIGFLGRLHPTKGIEWLLDCLTRFGLEDYTLDVAGEGEEGYVDGLRSKYSSEKIRFLGFANPADLFARVDLLVMPSLWNEPLGRVIFEAYAHGIPVIASNRGGAPEIIDENETGYVFDPDEPRSLMSVLERLQSSPNLLARLQAGAARKAAEFTREAIVQKYEAAYHEVMKR
jgi:glycosyltransferase involved in cell wall biosynthesis